MPRTVRPPAPAATRVTHLNVNGARHALSADPEARLLFVLRDQLDLTGSKYGCGEGQCSACLVLIDGKPRHSCLTSVGEVGEGEITTIEGLEKNGELHPVQQAFLEVEAMQCGYCTPGMILGTVALLKKNSNPTPAEVTQAMNGHLCRCGTYQRVHAAIQLAAKRLRGEMA